MVCQFLSFTSRFTLHASHFKNIIPEDRFKSEPIEDEKYLLTTIRYIHENPVKAGMVEKIDEYEYSSYNECGIKIL